MKSPGLLLLTLGLALAGVPSGASQETGETTFTLLSHTRGGSFFWTLEGNDTKNPELVVVPNATITITIRNADGGFHNLQVEGHGPSPYIREEGDTQTVTFAAPASGTLDYFCVPHKTSGMIGTLRVAGTPVAERDETPAASAAALAIAAAGAALLLRRR